MLARPLLVTLALSATAVGCGGGDDVESDAERFCGEAIARRDTIVAPSLTSEAELAATLDFFRLMGRLAPIAIAEEWNILAASLETAATVVPGDPESEQRVAMTAYAAEPAAYAVQQWLAANCGLDIPLTTIAPQERGPARTATTVVDSTVPTTDGE